MGAMKGGYEAYPVVNTMGGTSRVAHDAALSRLEQEAAKLTGWVQVICEL